MPTDTAIGLELEALGPSKGKDAFSFDACSQGCAMQLLTKACIEIWEGRKAAELVASR